MPKKNQIGGGPICPNDIQISNDGTFIHDVLKNIKDLPDDSNFIGKALEISKDYINIDKDITYKLLLLKDYIPKKEEVNKIIEEGREENRTGNYVLIEISKITPKGAFFWGISKLLGSREYDIDKIIDIFIKVLDYIDNPPKTIEYISIGGNGKKISKKKSKKKSKKRSYKRKTKK
jgi:hypothetical protein